MSAGVTGYAETNALILMRFVGVSRTVYYFSSCHFLLILVYKGIQKNVPCFARDR